jgi:hypothetical protein
MASYAVFPGRDGYASALVYVDGPIARVIGDDEVAEGLRRELSVSAAGSPRELLDPATTYHDAGEMPAEVIARCYGIS